MDLVSLIMTHILVCTILYWLSGKGVFGHISTETNTGCDINDQLFNHGCGNETTIELSDDVR